MFPDLRTRSNIKRYTPDAVHEGTVAPEPSTASPYIHGLDGLRALAVIAVLGYHLFPDLLPAGLVGVDIFFILSGFLITGLLLRERHICGSIALASFWRRRIRRLVPAAAAVLLICSSAAAMLGGDVLVGIGRQLIGALTYSSNWLDIANGSDYFAQGAPELFTHFWSLALEEQFYLIWPLLFLLITSAEHRPLPRAATAMGIAIASAAAARVMAALGASDSRIYYGTDTHLFGLMLGASLALLIPHGLGSVWPSDGPPVLRLRGITAVGSLAALILLLIYWPNDSSTTGGQQLGSLLTVGVIQGLIGPTTPILAALRRLMSIAPLRWLGRRSYGIYLWHWPLLVLVHYWAPHLGSPSVGLLVAGLSLALAEASHRWIETPIQRNGIRSTARNWGAALHSPRKGLRRNAMSAGLVMALVVSGTVTALLQAPATTALEQQLDSAKSTLSSQPQPAPTFPPQSPTIPPNVAEPRTENVPSSEPPDGQNVTVIGDSVALASASALQESFPGVYIDAQVNRKMETGAEIVEQMAQSGTLRPILVIALATNSTFSLSTIQAIEAAAGSSREVIFVNSMAPADIPWAGQANEVLADAARTELHIKIADWHGAMAQHLDLLASDGVHPGPEGARIYAQTIASAIRAPD